MLKPDYIRDGRAIYERSFAIIRAEADLSRFTPEQADVAVRMIHACGQVDAAGPIAFSRTLVQAARDALRRLEGSLVAIGNAPTALFHLLEMLEAGAPKPAAIIGIPVGFVGAAESKDALAANTYNVPYLIVRGRMGGSAMTAAAINALAKEGL